METNHIIILSVVIILVILIILFFTYRSTVSNFSAVQCNAGQICCTACFPSPINVYNFIFTYVYGLTYQTFSDYQSGKDIVMDPLATNYYTNGSNSPSAAGRTRVYYLTTDTSIGSGVIYQYQPEPISGTENMYAILIYPTTVQGNNFITGVTARYSFNDITLLYSQANVSNGNNLKLVYSNITDSNATTSSYLGVCDLTSWWNQLTQIDRNNIGFYKGNITINGTPGLDPTTNSLPLFDNTTLNILSVMQNMNNTGVNNGGAKATYWNAPYGALVTSFTVGTQSSSIPYPPIRF